MKRWLLVLMLVGLLLPVVPIKALDTGYSIEQYNITIDVQDNGRYLVNEEILVNFSEYRHGIYRTIPTNYLMNWKIDGQEIQKEYNFPVINIGVDQTFETESTYEGVSIKIGDADKYVTGLQEYNIRYEMITKDLGLKGDQLFYLNLVGTQWTSTIKQVHAEIHFPKAIDPTLVQVYSGAQGNTGAEGAVCVYQSETFILVCDTNRVLDVGEGLTVYLPLVDNYYQFPDYNYLYTWVLMFSGALVVFIGMLYLKFGKDAPVIKTVEFSPPEGLNAGCVGFIVDEVVNDRDIIGLILEWAKNGLIVIDDTRVELTFIKQKDLPDDHPLFERVFFTSFFRTKDEVTISDIKTDIAPVLQQLKRDIPEFFRQPQRKLFYTSSTVIQWFLMLLVGLPPVMTLAVAYLVNNYYLGAGLLGLVVVIAIWIGLSVALKFLLAGYYVESGIKRFGQFIGFALILGFASIIILGVGFWLNVNFLYLLVSMVTSFIMMIMVAVMNKRTEYGSRVFGQCLGLYDFIKTAEYDRLKMLLEENPQLFYDVLPYAYVFNMTDLWAKHFKQLTIPQPTFYRTNQPFETYLVLSHLNRAMYHTQNTFVQSRIESMKAAQGSGGSGGFGGGGFSGGGFGGGGGGSW